MKNLPKIYCDMDGVLFDFKSYAEKNCRCTIVNGRTYQR